MANKSTRYTREFSFTRPVMYQREQYPSADSVITDEYGNKSNGQIFADAYGQYYTKDKNNNIFPVMPVESLDEVTISAPRKRDNLSEAFSRFLALGNDNTQVNNLPHREYNTSLKANAERGAREHALWDKEHPNLSAWRDAATAVPFAVAATPFVAGGGSALLNTGLGQAAKHGIAALMKNPYVAGANDALGLGFAGKGAYDVSQGKFTPETAMDIASGAGLMYKSSSMFDRMLTARKARKLAKNPIKVITMEDVDLGFGDLTGSSTFYEDIANGVKQAFPLKGETEIPISIRASAARKYNDFINSEEYQQRLQKAGLEDHWDYMKNLTNRRINNNGYFPSHVKFDINGDSDVLGLSAVEPSSPNYGITLQEDLSKNEINETMMHELSHWATGNAGVNDIANGVKYPFRTDPNVNSIGDIMRYNESITPNIAWEDILNNLPKDTPIDKIMEIQDTYNYLIRPTEKRARLMSVYQQAKDAGMSTDAFVDKYTKNNKILPTAPMNLGQLGEILTVNNIKNGLNNFLSIAAPIGIATSINKKQHE